MEEHRYTQGLWQCSSDKKEPGLIQVELRFPVPTMSLRWLPYFPHRPKAPRLLGNLMLAPPASNIVYPLRVVLRLGGPGTLLPTTPGISK